MKFKTAISITAACMLLSGCSLVNEELPECRNDYRLRFTDSYNLLNADAFAGEVGSLALWAFDESGRNVWACSSEVSGPNGNLMALPASLPAGIYDLVVWGGLDAQSGFTLATDRPGSPDDLRVSLQSESRAASVVSKADIGPLFHSMVNGIEITRDPSAPISKTIVVPLVKDTHVITVVLANTDGSPVDAALEVSVTASTSALEFDNMAASSPAVEYLPWKTAHADAVIPDGHGGSTSARSAASISTLTVSRLFASGPEPRLHITRRHADSRENVADLPLVSTILLGKGRYEEMPPQEYLDRCGEWTLFFFLDPRDGGWNVKSVIYVNNWAVVPPQIAQP